MIRIKTKRIRQKMKKEIIKKMNKIKNKMNKNSNNHQQDHKIQKIRANQTAKSMMNRIKNNKEMKMKKVKENI